jgi:hypothetical protein
VVEVRQSEVQGLSLGTSLEAYLATLRPGAKTVMV